MVVLVVVVLVLCSPGVVGKAGVPGGAGTAGVLGGAGTAEVPGTCGCMVS